jgi:hypothetical protein
VIETGPFEICVRKGGSFEIRPRGRFVGDALLRGWPFREVRQQGFCHPFEKRGRLVSKLHL